MGLGGRLVSGLRARDPARRPERGAVPCAACQSFSLAPQPIAALPERLDGTRVLVRAARRDERPRTGRRRSRSCAVAAAAPASTSWACPQKPIRAGCRRRPSSSSSCRTADAGSTGLRPEARADASARPPPGDDPADRRLAWDARRRCANAVWAPTSTRFLPARRADRRRRRSPDADCPRTVGRVWRLPDGAEAARAILRLAAALQSWLPAGLVPVDGRALNCGEVRPLPTFPESAHARSRRREPFVPGAGDCDLRRPRCWSPSGWTLVRLRSSACASTAATASRRASTWRRRARSQSTRSSRGIRPRRPARPPTSHTTIASGSMTLTFEAPGFVAPITITSQTTIFSRAGSHRHPAGDIRVNGVCSPPAAACRGCPSSNPSALPRRRSRSRCRTSMRIASLDAGIPARPRRLCRRVLAARRRASLYEGRAWIDAGRSAWCASRRRRPA